MALYSITSARRIRVLPSREGNMAIAIGFHTSVVIEPFS